MDLALLTVIGIVAVALLFDYTNGFHDSANSISTIVATRVLRPRQAVLWAAFFNVVGATDQTDLFSTLARALGLAT
jgi:PiT family inorganic phosphate transporter